MNSKAQNSFSTCKLKIFNNPEFFIEGWYWVMRSKNLRVGEVKPVTILGKELTIYRGKNRKVIIADAYCPHMGAHLAEGKIEGNALRCFFHHWKFDAEGNCVSIPCLDKPLPVKLKIWTSAEKYGLIWIWTGKTPPQPIPFTAELKQKKYDIAFGPRIVMNCHPNVVMINAIDLQHFNTVHKLATEIVFKNQELNQNAILFSNIKYDGRDSFYLKLIRLFYKDTVKYSVCYWYGSTGIATIGTKFFHLHLMFALRLLEGGKTEAQSLLLMNRRKGIVDLVFGRAILWFTQICVTHFIKGDTKIFQTIRFNLKTPIKVDRPIMQLIDHVERQKPLDWGTWEDI